MSKQPMFGKDGNTSCAILLIVGFTSIVGDIHDWGKPVHESYSKFDVIIVIAFVLLLVIPAWRYSGFTHKHSLLALMLAGVLYDAYRAWVHNPIPHDALSVLLGLLWMATGALFYARRTSAANHPI